MDVRYGREITVGSIVLVAVALFVGGTMWLSGKSFRAGGGVKVRFSDVGLLKRASPVRVSGVPVGRVEDIRLVAPGHVVVTITLPGIVQPKADATARVVQVGLAGDAALAFDPGTSATPLAPDAEVPGRVDAGIADRVPALADRADSVMIGVQALANQAMADRMARTLEELQATLTASRRLMALYADRERGPSAELERTMVEFRAVAARLDSTLGAPSVVRARDQADTLVRNLSQMSAQLRSTGERLDTLLARVERGEGSLGRLATDPALHDQTVRLMASMDSLIADLRKHPGKIGVTVKLF